MVVLHNVSLPIEVVSKLIAGGEIKALTNHRIIPKALLLRRLPLILLQDLDWLLLDWPFPRLIWGQFGLLSFKHTHL